MQKSNVFWMDVRNSVITEVLKQVKNSQNTVKLIALKISHCDY